LTIRHAEIDQDQFLTGGCRAADHAILGLHIAVIDVVRMDLIECGSDLAKKPGALSPRQRAAIEQTSQRASLDKFHGEAGRSVRCLAMTTHTHDTGVGDGLKRRDFLLAVGRRFSSLYNEDGSRS
jgi:hypothetical protein